MKNNRTVRRGMGVLAILGIVLQSGGDVGLSVLALFLWLGALACFDRRILKVLWIPKFWLFTLLFALLSGFFLGKRDVEFLGFFFSKEGLAAGFMMIVRGAFIFALASWGTRLLDGEGWRRLFGKVGAKRLGTSVAVAMSLLPELKDRWQNISGKKPGVGSRWRRMMRAVVFMLCQTAQLAFQLAMKDKNRSAKRTLLAVIGLPDAGKTTFLMSLADRLQKQGVRIGGIVQPKVREGCKRRGYRLQDVEGGEERDFCFVRDGESWSRCEFLDDGWAWAKDRLLAGRTKAQVLFADELGRIEASGNGHMSALAAPLASESTRIWVLGVRQGVEGELEKNLGPFAKCLRGPFDEKTLKETADWIVETLTHKNGSEEDEGNTAMLDGTVAVDRDGACRTVL
jgi:nucleoside-triphosphatase THEP1